MIIKNYNNESGLTLIESLVTITILAIVVSSSLPSLINTINTNKMNSARDGLFASINLAQSTAITSGSWATICSLNASHDQCLSDVDNWDQGWVVFSDDNKDGKIDSSEKIISTKTDVPSGIIVNATNNRITYDNQGIARDFKTTFLICNKTSSDTSFAIQISAFGRLKEVTTDEIDIDCDE